jgi:hypothetical protein
VGVLVGRAVEYFDEHFRKAESLLRTHELPVAPLGRATSRADAAVYGGMTEKAFSTAPHSDSVAVRAVGPCIFAGRELFTPRGSYIVLTLDQAAQVTCQRLMLVVSGDTRN